MKCRCCRRQIEPERVYTTDYCVPCEERLGRLLDAHDAKRVRDQMRSLDFTDLDTFIEHLERQ